MKKIPLSGRRGEGKYTIVDNADFEKYGRLKWNLRKKSVSRNVIAGGKQHTEILSRLILNAPEWNWVDHINGNILDNRRENLRLCTPIENTWNKSLSGRNKSGFKGVSYKKQQGKYYAYITVRGKVKHLGVFDDPTSAALAYNEEALRSFGKFAKLNSI